jgi:CRISPR-associated protein Cas1
MILENTLYVMTQGAYVRLNHETVMVEVDKRPALQVPLHHVGQLVVFGNVLISPFLIQRLLDDGKCVHWLTEFGRYIGSTIGRTHGNVLLRRAQYAFVDDPSFPVKLSTSIVTAKIKNQYNVLMRGAREAKDQGVASRLRDMAACVGRLESVAERGNLTLNKLRGIEGMVARYYFSALPLLIRRPGDWGFRGRNKRPARDPINSMLSYGYAILRGDCVSGCELAGLDPQVGYLHVIRPGRPALALDLMELFRSAIVDRTVLTLINRQQVGLSDFEERPGGGVVMLERTRRALLTAYQERKRDEVYHPMFKARLPVGLLPLVQARLLARYIRGDLRSYPTMVFG